MTKLTDFEKIFDADDVRLSGKRQAAQVSLAGVSGALTHFLKCPRAKVYLSKSGSEDIRVLFSTDGMFGRVVPTIASFIGFGTRGELGFYSMNTATKELALIAPDTPWGEDTAEATIVDPSDYADGKVRTARDDAGNTWQCKITITAAAWQKVESQKTAADPATIKGILGSDTVWISPISKKKGDRCIKPEPYGWIFSTNGSVRLIDPTTSVTNTRPAALTFSKVDNVK